VSRYNREFGATLTADQVDSWDAMGNLTHFETMGAFWRWASKGPGGSIFRHLETYPGAVETLERLARNHDIVILTAKPDWAVHDTFAWIAEHRIPTREIHITEDKWRVPCDVYLDDSPRQVRELRARRPDALVCRFVRPWNDPVQGARDVASWSEFASVVDEHRP
jgi:5'(3')-deoxyribonucleotidase